MGENPDNDLLSEHLEWAETPAVIERQPEKPGWWAVSDQLECNRHTWTQKRKGLSQTRFFLTGIFYLFCERMQGGKKLQLSFKTFRQQLFHQTDMAACKTFT